jgi:hypothetical protein
MAPKKPPQIQTELHAAVKEASNRHKLSRFFPKQQLQSPIPSQRNKKGLSAFTKNPS